MIDHDPIADELLAAGFARSPYVGEWRDPVTGIDHKPDDALRIARRDHGCAHHELTHAPDAGTDVEGAVLVRCVGCDWTRVAVRAA